MKAAFVVWLASLGAIVAFMAAHEAVPEGAARFLGAFAGLLSLVGGIAGSIAFCAFARGKDGR